MQSITQENDLDAFLSTAALAGTDFTAGKRKKRKRKKAKSLSDLNFFKKNK